MARIGRIPGKDIVDTTGDVLDFYEQNGIALVRTMPDAKSLPPTQAEQKSANNFARNAARASIVKPPVLASAWSIAEGGSVTWRDVVLSAMYGNLMLVNGQKPLYGPSPGYMFPFVLAYDMEYEQYDATRRLMGIWTDVNCYARFTYQFTRPVRRRRRRIRRGIMQTCGYIIDFNNNPQQSPWDIYGIDYNTFQVLVPPDVYCVYYFAEYRFEPGPGEPQSPSTSVLGRACRYPGRTQLELHGYVCPAYGAVPPIAGYPDFSIITGEPYPCVPNPE